MAYTRIDTQTGRKLEGKVSAKVRNLVQQHIWSLSDSAVQIRIKDIIFAQIQLDRAKRIIKEKRG